MPNPKWNPPNDPPDSDTTVLLRLSDAAEPVWPGFHDGYVWRYASGATIPRGEVAGWMELHNAAEALDAA